MNTQQEQRENGLLKVLECVSAAHAMT